MSDLPEDVQGLVVNPDRGAPSGGPIDVEVARRANRTVLGCGVLSFGVPFGIFLVTGDAGLMLMIGTFLAGFGFLLWIALAIIRNAKQRPDS